MVTYYGTTASEVIDFRDSGNDFIYGDGGNDAIYGWYGNDNLYGEAGNDIIVGYYGDDYLSGGSGNDTLNGEYGYDTLNGGLGADTFILGNSSQVFDLGLGYDTIIDFYYTEGDYFQVFGSISNYSLDRNVDYGGSSAFDTAISYNGDLLAVVQDTTNVYLLDDFVSV